MRLNKNLGVKILVGLVLLGLLVCFRFTDFSRTNSPPWPEQIAEEEFQLTIPIFREEIEPTNGFFYINELARIHGDGFEGWDSWTLGANPGNEALIKNNPEIIRLFENAVACSFWRGRTALDLGETAEDLDCIRPCADITKMNRYRLVQLAKSEDWVAFKSIFSDQCRFQGKMLEGAPSLFMGSLFCIQNGVTLNGVDWAFALSDPPPDVLQSMVDDLQKMEAQMPPYAESIRHNVLIYEHTLEHDFSAILEELPFVVRPHTPWEKRKTVKNLRSIFGLMIQDSEAGYGKSSRVNEWVDHPDHRRIFRRTNPAGRALVRLMSDVNADRSRDRYLMAFLHLEAVHCAIALEKFHQENGSYPASFNELPCELPVDISSLAGEPLIYRKVNESNFILYARGENRADDGGDPAADRIFHRSDPLD